ncbi:MAG: DUF2269 domain-containing protein [Actinomycetota bacterium]|nr:DUF2269 domain-containing protein [Actinomycetota bacterium]
MSYYEVLLFLHISFVAIWVGAALLIQALTFRSRASGDPQLMAALGPHSQWLAQRIFIPSSLAVLVLGILLTIEGPWTFDQLWIVLGLAGLAATFVVGLGVIEPTAKKMTAAIEANGPGSPEAEREDRRLYALGFLDLALLFAVIWDMTLKPTADDIGTLLVPALALAAATLNVVRTYRAADTPAVEPTT